MTISLAPLVQRFFVDRLRNQMQASPNTIASYADTFRLLLNFAYKALGRAPTKLLATDLTAELIGAFLDDLEENRGSTARTRNNRLAAIRSFFRYIAANQPELLFHCQRITTMPNKRHDRKVVSYLVAEEMDALLGAPNRTTHLGRRDHALLLVALRTGMRASELIGLVVNDVVLGRKSQVHCLGKGRKERNTPITPDTAKVLKAWLRELGAGGSSPLFPAQTGGKLSRDALSGIVRKHAATATRHLPSLGSKHITPHVLRHSTAMDLLHHGIDRSTIALILGHESIETTQIYIHADMTLKERALARVTHPDATGKRFKASDDLLSFLKDL